MRANQCNGGCPRLFKIEVHKGLEGEAFLGLLKLGTSPAYGLDLVCSGAKIYDQRVSYR